MAASDAPVPTDPPVAPAAAAETPDAGTPAPGTPDAGAPDAGPSGPGFWSTVGQGLLRGARAAGSGMRAAVEAVDPDARRDLARLPVLGLASLGPRTAPVRAKGPDGHRPVICVHGLGGHRANFRMMRAWMALQGRRRTYAVGLPPGLPLAELGRELVHYIEEVVAINGLGPDDQVDIVAHSMGGLVARLALLDVDLVPRVHTLLTLGTPPHGTQAARVTAHDRARELRPGSPVMQSIAGQLPWHGSVRLVCLWSHADPLMQPATTARVEGAVNRELSTLTHTQYLLERAAFRAVHEALAAPRG